MTPLILASASPARAEMLRANHVPLEVVPAQVDEAALKAALDADGVSARDSADALAEFKARRIAQRRPDRLVLGADQILVCDGARIDKATSPSQAHEHLRLLSGRSHSLLSAAVIFEDAQPVWRHIGRADLTMRPLGAAFLDSYIARHGDDLTATVGGYWLEKDGASLFSRISGDYFSVLGLPLLEVLQFLRTRGLIPE